MARARHDLGYTLVELLIGIGLLTLIASAIYSLLVTMDRGLVLLTGQLNAQQNPRISLERMMDDIQNATYLTVSPTSPVANTAQSLWITKTTILCASANAGASSIIVANGNDFQVGQTIWLSAAGVGNAVTATANSGEQIRVKATATFPAGACNYTQLPVGYPYGTMSGTQVDLATALQGSYPWGTLVSPISVQYQVGFQNSAVQLQRGTITGTMVNLASNVSGFFASGFSSALAAQANTGDKTLTIINQPNTNGAVPFTVGNKVYVNPSSTPFIANVTGVTVTPGTNSTVLSIDTAAPSTFAVGTPVQTLPYVTTMSKASPGDGTIVVNNSISGVLNFGAGDLITVDVTGSANPAETRSVSCSTPPQALNASTTQITLALASNCNTAAPLFYGHNQGAQVAKRAAQIGVTDTQVDSAAGGFQAPSDTDTGEGAARN